MNPAAKDPPWLEYQRRRFMRQDAWRYVKPGTPGYDMPPGIGYQEPADVKKARERRAFEATKAAAAQAEADERAFRNEVAAIKFELLLIGTALQARRRWRAKAGFNPDQPRVPAGNPDGGQWTDGNGNLVAEGEPDGRVSSPIDQLFGEGVSDLSASSKNRGDGHHYVPRGVLKQYDISEEALSVFKTAKTGPLIDVRSNRWDQAHMEYNEAVNAEFKKYLSENKIDPSRMTRDEAQEFTRRVLDSKDPRIRDFNLGIHIREIMRRLLRRSGADQ